MFRKESPMANELRGSKVAILIAPVGTEQIEFTEPKKAVEEAGATVEVVGLQTGDAQTMNGDVNPGETFTVEKSASEVSVGEDRKSTRLNSSHANISYAVFCLKK